MNNKIFAILTAIILILTAAVLADSGIDKLHLKRINGETVLKIDASGPFQYTHQIEEAKDGKPFRIIIDFFPAVHHLGQKIFANLPASIIASLRTSQYATKPEKIVRVVLDLQKSSIYRIEKSGNCAFVYIPDNEHADFAEWASSGSSNTTALAKESSPKPAETAVSIIVESNTVISNETVPVEMAGPGSSVLIETTENNIETSAASPEITGTEPVETPVAPPKYYRPRQSGFLEREMAEMTKQSEMLAQAMMPVSTENVAPVQTPAENPMPAPPDSQLLASNIATLNKKAADSQMAANPVVPTAPSTEKSTINTAVATEDKEAKKSEKIASTDSTVNPEDAYFDSDMVAQGLSPDDMPALDKSAIDTSIEASAGNRPTSRFRREPVMPTKLKGTIVAQFPQRMVIEYAPGEFRDPFESLIDDTKGADEIRENRIPDVETSRLVGILESETGHNRALLEDIDGYGFILKPGDKVKKGYVDHIDSDKAFFQLFEYGWSRTIALYLGRN